MPSLAVSSNLSDPAPENWEAKFAPKFIKVHLIGKDRCENSQPVVIRKFIVIENEGRSCDPSQLSLKESRE